MHACMYLIAEPSGWKFTRDDLNEWLRRLAARESTRLRSAA
jgi:hypothetical protein